VSNDDDARAPTRPAKVRRTAKASKNAEGAPPAATAGAGEPAVASEGARPASPAKRGRGAKSSVVPPAPAAKAPAAAAPAVALKPKRAGRPRGVAARAAAGERASAGPDSIAARPVARPLGRPPLLDDPRAEILQQAARLFAEKGYAAGSLAELASAMNYSKGAIYNYFSSKQEIYDAIIIFTLTGLYETAAAAVRREDPPVEQLRQYMVAHARFLADNYDCFVTMLVGFSGMANSELKDDALTLRDAHEGLLRRIIADGVADGTFRAVSAAMTGRAVLSLLSWMVRWFKPGRGKSAEEVAQEYHDLLVRGLLPVLPD